MKYKVYNNHHLDFNELEFALDRTSSFLPVNVQLVNLLSVIMVLQRELFKGDSEGAVIDTGFRLEASTESDEYHVIWKTSVYTDGKKDDAEVPQIVDLLCEVPELKGAMIPSYDAKPGEFDWTGGIYFPASEYNTAKLKNYAYKLLGIFKKLDMNLVMSHLGNYIIGGREYLADESLEDYLDVELEKCVMHEESEETLKEFSKDSPKDAPKKKVAPIRTESSIIHGIFNRA